MLWPHEFAHALHSHMPGSFDERILGGSAETIPKFWEQMQGHPALEEHPLLEREDRWTKCVPFSMHSDGVPVAGIGKSWGKSVDIISWKSCLTTATWSGLTDPTE